MNDFCTLMAEILDTEEVCESDVLNNFPAWDSLSALLVIAMLDSKYDVNLTSMDIKDVRTVADLWNLAQLKKKS
jgi:acyl carrier protein